MQLIIDTNESHPKKLRLYAAILLELADGLQDVNLDDNIPLNLTAPTLPVPAGTPPANAPIPGSLDAPPPSVDARGMPWDDRIHSSSKAINQADGTWRARRGVSQQLVENVEAELRARVAAGGQAPQAAAVNIPVPPTTSGAAPSVAAPVSVPLPVQTPVVPVPQSVPSVPSVGLPVPAVAAPAAGTVPDTSAQDFNALMVKFNTLGAQRGWAPDVLTKAVNSAGLAGVNDLIGKSNYIQLVSFTLDTYAQTGVK